MAPFRHRLRVRYSECDQQNIVFNGHYLFYFDLAITELWREALGPYQETVAELGVDMVVAEARIRYLAPLHFDDEFDLVAELTRLGTTSIVTAISAERDGTTCAEGEIRHVFVAPGTHEKTAIPDAVRTALGAYAR
jgi:acyl-CoA thioester hydrolase